MAFKRRIVYVILTLAVICCGNPVSRSQVDIHAISYPQDETSEHDHLAGTKYYITNNAPSNQNSFDLTTANVFENEETNNKISEQCEQTGQVDGQSGCETQNTTPSQVDQVDNYIDSQDYDQSADTSGESTMTEYTNQNYDQIQVTSENNEIMETTSSKSIKNPATTTTLSFSSSTSPRVTSINGAIFTNSILSSTSPTPTPAQAITPSIQVSTASMPVSSSVFPTSVSVTPDVTSSTSPIAPVLSPNNDQGFLSSTNPSLMPNVQSEISPTTLHANSLAGSFTTPRVTPGSNNGNPTTESRPHIPTGSPSHVYGPSTSPTPPSIPSSYVPNNPAPSSSIPPGIPYVPATTSSITPSYGPHSSTTPPNIPPSNQFESSTTPPIIPPGYGTYIPATPPSIPSNYGPNSPVTSPNIPPNHWQAPPGIPPGSDFNNPFHGSDPYNPVRTPPRYDNNGPCTNCGVPSMPRDFRPYGYHGGPPMYPGPTNFHHSMVPPMWPPFAPSGVPQPMFPPRHFGYGGPFPPPARPSVVINAWPFGRGGEPSVGFNPWPFTHGGIPSLFPGPVPLGGIDVYGPSGHHPYPHF